MNVENRCPKLDHLEYDVCRGWFVVTIWDGSSWFLVSREHAKNLRDALTVFVDDVEDLEPSRAYKYHEYLASLAGPAPKTTVTIGPGTAGDVATPQSVVDWLEGKETSGSDVLSQ